MSWYVSIFAAVAAVFSTRETTAALAPPAAETTATSFPSVEAGVEVGVPLATATALACQVHSNPGLQIGRVFGNVRFWICFSLSLSCFCELLANITGFPIY